MLGRNYHAIYKYILNCFFVSLFLFVFIDKNILYMIEMTVDWEAAQKEISTSYTLNDADVAEALAALENAKQELKDQCPQRIRLMSSRGPDGANHVVLYVIRTATGSAETLDFYAVKPISEARCACNKVGVAITITFFSVVGCVYYVKQLFR
jgi:hypothetical protein